MFAELFDTCSGRSRVNCAAMARQWNHLAMERQIRNGGDCAGLHLNTLGQLRRYMDEVLKSMANDEGERCWAARQAADGSGGVPAATGEVPRSQAGDNEAADSASGVAHGAGASGAMAGGALAQQSGALAERQAAVTRRRAALAEQLCRAAGIYDADILAHCAAVLHGRGEEVPANDARIVKRYCRGRFGGLTTAASRRKGLKTRARHDKADTGTNKEPAFHFLLGSAHMPLHQGRSRAPVPPVPEGVEPAK